MSDPAASVTVDFSHRKLPGLDREVHRLGLAPSFGLDEGGVREALFELGLNYVYWTPRMGRATSALRAALARERERFVVATGPATAWWGSNLRRFVDRALSVLRTDYLDVLQMHWLGVTASWTPRVVDTMLGLRDEGKVRALGASIHNRKRAGELAGDSPLDLLMIRYNAAHPGAERDIFPRLGRNPKIIVAYTATAWRRLLKPRSGWNGPPMTAGDCYRFCLSNPAVDVVLCGPKDREQLRDNLRAVRLGPLDEKEMARARAFGQVVHG